MKKMIQFLTCATFLLATFSRASTCPEEEDTYWSYSTNSSVGPNKWGTLHHQCTGRKQSPINIIRSDMKHDTSLGPLILHKYSYFFHMQAKYVIANHGHTIAMKITWPIKYIVPISMSFQRDKFKFHEIQFHWGLNNSEGSEHQIDGNSFAVEMQVIHFNSRYCCLVCSTCC